MMTFNELKQAIATKNKFELSEQPGMVYQIWEDGEITLQKSGPLLWGRTLHCIVPGDIPLTKELMPIEERLHGYAFIESLEVGMELRKLMQEYINQSL